MHFLLQGTQGLKSCLLHWQVDSFTTELSAAAATKSLQSCPTLCDPTDGSPPGSSVHRRQEYWSGLPFPSPTHACMLSRFRRVRLCVTLWTAAHQAPLSTGFSGQEYWSGLPFPSPRCFPKYHAFFSGIFRTPYVPAVYESLQLVL